MGGDPGGVAVAALSAAQLGGVGAEFAPDFDGEEL